jgi:CHRD domain
MKSLSLFGLLVLGLGVAACGSDGDMPTTPSPASSAMFTAALLPASEVPPITGGEANGSGTATLTFNLTKDAAGYITSATMDATVTVQGFPAGTALTASHIHPGVVGANGGVFVSLGLAAGEVTFATGSGSFTKRGVTVTADEANAILANPANFYLNIHTAANPGGVARGQLIRVQ